MGSEIERERAKKKNDWWFKSPFSDLPEGFFARADSRRLVGAFNHRPLTRGTDPCPESKLGLQKLPSNFPIRKISETRDTTPWLRDMKFNLREVA